jgi:hypothetical protein
MTPCKPLVSNVVVAFVFRHCQLRNHNVTGLPGTKRPVRRRFRKRSNEARQKRLHVFSEVRPTICHEGDKLRTVCEDGMVDETSRHRCRSEFSFTREQLENMTIDQLVEKFESVGQEIGEQQLRHTFQTLDSGLEKVGHVFQHKKDDYVEGFLKALDTVWLEFEEDGSPVLPSLVAGTEAAAGLEAALERIENDDELKKRRDDIIARQRERWRARESDRKLVG